MIDAHCHIRRAATRHLLCAPFTDAPTDADVVFYGLHPWTFNRTDISEASLEAALACVRAAVCANPRAGVGEIGLDRLKAREIPSRARAAFEAQLRLAADEGRRVVLHGAKCWGEVARAAEIHRARIPAFLFHGFSRSGGLLPDIVRMNGFIGVGMSLLNDHALNYRALVKALPLERILLESDATEETRAKYPPLETLARCLAEVRNMPLDELVEQLETNVERFLGAG